MSNIRYIHNPDGEPIPFEGTAEEYNQFRQNLEYKNLRRANYNIPLELNLLVDDINDGIFGEAAKTGKFMQYVNSIKTAYPKQR